MAEGDAAIGSDDECKNYSVLNSHQSHHKLVHDVLDAPHFCEAFFHVPQVERNEEEITREMQCLDRNNCRVYKLENENPKSQPKHVVSFVVLKKGNVVKYKALFENCVQQRDEGTKHAEEFFLEDARERELDGLMYMYITLQPCHESITHAREKSCTKKLIEFYKKNLNIHFIVKPTFIYKAYRSSTEEEIINAKEGLKQLFKEGIQVQAMEEEDWTFLKNHLCPSIELFPGSSYEESERKKLDKFIDEILKEIESDSDPPPRGSDSPSSGSDSPSSGSDSPSSDGPSTASGSATQPSYNGSGARPKELRRKEKDDYDKKKETEHGKLASNQQPNTTTCTCKNMCVQKDGNKKKGCPCKTVGEFCHQDCKCGTPTKHCKNRPSIIM